jgi:hypothetical protein
MPEVAPGSKKAGRVWDANARDGLGAWRSNNGQPIAQMPAVEDGYTSWLLRRKAKLTEVEKEIDSPLLDASGKPIGTTTRTVKETRDMFDNVRLDGNATELGAIAKETQQNQHLKASFTEALYENYRKHTMPDGKNWSSKAHEEWLGNSKKLLLKVFSPEEYRRIVNSPQGLRGVMQELRGRSTATQKAVSSILDATGEDTMRLLNNNGRMLEKLKTLYRSGDRMDQKKFERIFKILRAHGDDGQYAALGELFKDEMYQTLSALNTKQPTRASIRKISNWFEDATNTNMLRELFDGQYVADLRTAYDVIAARSRRQGVRGLGVERSPASLQFFRAILFKNVFGRRQRAFSAGTKTAQQQAGKLGLRIAETPEQLRTIMAIKDAPIDSRAALGMLSRLGILEAYGVTDPNDPRQIRQFIMDATADVEALEVFADEEESE